MRKPAVLCVATLALLVLLAGPAASVTRGEPDGDAHPHVGLLVFDVDGSPAWSCSGTLLSPTVLLTAGHCTFGADGGRVWFEPDATGTDFPFGDGTSIEFAEVHTHPEYDEAAFAAHDLGVVVLSEPVDSPRYGQLADVGTLDALSTRRGRQDQLFTVVGYGLQSVVPQEQADLVRHRGTVRLIDTRGTAGIPAGTSAMFSSNAGRPAAGGMCFGDSGGPVFVEGTDIVVAVVSAVNTNCVGIGGGYRVDTVEDRAFVEQFLDR